MPRTDHSSPDACPRRAQSVALLCLLLCVVLQSVGIGGRYLLSTFETESDIYGLLYFDWSWPEVWAQRIDDAGTLGTLLAALPLLILYSTHRSQHARQPTTRLQSTWWIAAGLLTGMSLWAFLLALTDMVRGSTYAELALGEHAVRYCAPVALLWAWTDCETAEPRTAWTLLSWQLRIACAVTFAVHGWKAFHHYGPFTDLLLLSAANWGEFAFQQTQAETCLTVIGLMDLALAVLVLLTSRRELALYMAVWGVITSLSRITAFGWGAWPETLLRATNWGLPLTLACLFWDRRSTISRTSSHTGQGLTLVR